MKEPLSGRQVGKLASCRPRHTQSARKLALGSYNIQEGFLEHLPSVRKKPNSGLCKTCFKPIPSSTENCVWLMYPALFMYCIIDSTGRHHSMQSECSHYTMLQLVPTSHVQPSSNNFYHRHIHWHKRSRGKTHFFRHCSHNLLATTMAVVDSVLIAHQCSLSGTGTAALVPLARCYLCWCHGIVGSNDSAPHNSHSTFHSRALACSMSSELWVR